MSYTAALDALVANVNTAAIPVGHPPAPLIATRDPVELIAGRPCLLLMVDSIDYSVMCADGIADVLGLFVGVASDPGMTLLLEVVDQVAGLIGANTVQRVTWTPPGADPLPCFQLRST